MAFSKKELQEALKQMEMQGKMQEKLQNSAAEYAKHLKEIAELQKNISHIASTVKELEAEKKALGDELLKNRKASVGLAGDELKKNQEQRRELWKQIKIKKEALMLTKAQLDALEKTNDEYVDAAKNVNKLNLGLKEGVGFLKQTPALIKKGYGKLKGYGVFEMDKAIRTAGVEMGKMASVGTAFGRDIIKASTETQSMGMHVKDLAKMQSTYSSELGRSVMLSQEGFDAMSQMASGTILGADGAASLAAEMDRFNVSAEASRDIIEDTTNMSERMGLNAGKVIKGLQNNLKMANKYHFKGGVKGMVKMAAQAEKFHMSMETTAQFADKLFNIEGAVEMAASLNTMGGEWAKLGDPMKLMYQARNDMEGLQTSVIDATAGMADFNKETGEFEFSGLELHRMKELEKITGISAEQMAEMAKAKAKFAKINAQMGFEVGGDPEMKEFIENSAVFNKKSGQFEIKLSGSEKAIPVKELTATHKQMMIADAKSLKERAENSQTFDDQLSNMVENAKTLLLPLLEGLNAALPSIIKGFKDIMNSDLADKIKKAAKTIGDVVGGAIKFLIKFPSMIGAALVGVGLMKAAMWMINGRMLGMGFNQVARGGGVGGGKGGWGSSASKASAANMKRAPKGGITHGGKHYKGGQMYNAGGATKGGRFAAGSRGAMGAGLGLGVASMGLDYGRSMMDNQDSGAGKAMGIGSSALAGASMGMMLGPWGALVGGLIGGIYGAVKEFGAPPTGISGKGHTGMKHGGMITEPIEGVGASGRKYSFGEDGVNERVTPVGNGKPGTGSPGTTTNVKISFDEIIVKSDDNVGKIDLEKDSAFMRMLATKIKEELSRTANGGVLSPNPS